MTAASGDPGETPKTDGGDPEFPAYALPPEPGYPPPGPAYGIPPFPSYGAPIGEPAPAEIPVPGYTGLTPPPGYPPPPPAFTYPGSYPGAYPHPGYPGFPQAPQGGTNTLAIVSLICSILGLAPMCGFLLSIAGIITGAVAMNQVKSTGQQGYGLAVAGVVVGILTLLLWIVGFAYALR